MFIVGRRKPELVPWCLVFRSHRERSYKNSLPASLGCPWEASGSQVGDVRQDCWLNIINIAVSKCDTVVACQPQNDGVVIYVELRRGDTGLPAMAMCGTCPSLAHLGMPGTIISRGGVSISFRGLTGLGAHLVTSQQAVLMLPKKKPECAHSSHTPSPF